MDVASAFKPSAMFVSVQYFVAVESNVQLQVPSFINLSLVLTMNHPSFQCVELIGSRKVERSERAYHGTATVNTYHEGLVESEEDDKLDAQELPQGLLLPQLVLRKVVEHEKSV